MEHRAQGASHLCPAAHRGVPRTGPLLGAPTARRGLGEPRRGCWELVCRVARSGCIRWAAKWTQLTVARGCRQCGSVQRARSHASARRSPPRRQPAYSTIDVLLSTEVGMVQAPYGTTRVRASGVLSHPLASERGELPLLGPRRAALLHLRRAAHRRWLTLTCTHTRTILLSCARFSACSPTPSLSWPDPCTAFTPLPSRSSHTG